MTTQVSPIERFDHWRQEQPDTVFLRQPDGPNWTELSWSDTWNKASRLANHLSKLPPRSPVAIFSLNCADWFIADLAILMAGHISVPIYPTAGKSTIEYILQHSGVKIAFVGKLYGWKKTQECFSEVECISIFDHKDGLSHINDVIEKNEPLDGYFKPQQEDIATIIYTSGTTGNPKGVVISYRAIANALQTVNTIFSLTKDDRYFSYLPLAHVAERMAVEMTSLYFGGTVSFVESIDQFANNLCSVKPTIFFGVPRIWLKMKQGVEKKLGGPWLVKKLLGLPVVGNKLKSKLKDSLGLSHARLTLSGAASLPKDILDWFESLGIGICEVYGLSETSGFSHINLPEQRKIGTVGKPFPGANCMIADNGEILLRNASLMDGYYKEPDLSATAIQDGWFRTGDLGKVDTDNFLTITGRVKEIFKTAKGKYVAPAPIENALLPLLGVEQLCVMGANCPQPVAIVSLMGEISPAIQKKFTRDAEKVLNDVNQTLEPHDRVDKLFIVQEEWTTDNGMMTPTLKIRRQQVEEKYGPWVEKKLEAKQRVVWSSH